MAAALAGQQLVHSRLALEDEIASVQRVEEAPHVAHIMMGHDLSQQSQELFV